MKTQIRRRRTRHLIMVCTVCLNYRKLKLNEAVLSPRSGSFSQPTLRDNAPTCAVSALIKLLLTTPQVHLVNIHKTTMLQKGPVLTEGRKRSYSLLQQFLSLEYSPFQKGLCVQDSKQKVIKTDIWKCHHENMPILI